MKLQSFLLITLSLVQYSCGLNIMISSSNSWVSKNTRALQKSLQEENHNVILVAPAYNYLNNDRTNNIFSEIGPTNDLEVKELTDGGDFGHLLNNNIQSNNNQNNNNQNNNHRRPKNVVFPNDKNTHETELKSKHIRNKYYGQDFDNKDAWFVNSSPLQTLLVAFDIILPNYYPDFNPDLVILGPEEGTFFTPALESHIRILGEQATNLEIMAQLSLVKNTTVISVATEDAEHVYFKDEQNLESKQNPMKVGRHNQKLKSVNFINEKINFLLNKIQTSKGLSHENKPYWLNVNFPSTNNDDSRCKLSRKHPNENPNFKFISFAQEDSKIVRLPKYSVNNNGDLEISGEYGLNVDSQEISHTPQPQDRSDYVDTSSYYYMYKTEMDKEKYHESYQDYSDNDDFRKLFSTSDMEKCVLFNCGISLVASTLDKHGLPNFMDLDA